MTTGTLAIEVACETAHRRYGNSIATAFVRNSTWSSGDATSDSIGGACLDIANIPVRVTLK